MAAVRSLGLHEASAVSFLIAENLLPPNPSRNDYQWHTQVVEDEDGSLYDEDVIHTRSCVVWSRGGVIKRIFRFDIEKEEVHHVVFTKFSTGRSSSISDIDSSGANNQQSPKSAALARRSKAKAADAQQEVSILNLDTADNGYVPFTAQSNASFEFARALVVVLKSQAHIFFLAGNSYVIPLPFEVDAVFATPRGLLFQRKIQEEVSKSNFLSAPPNSFISTQPFSEPRASQSFRASQGKGQRLSSTISPSQNRRLTQEIDDSTNLPRTFSLTDPQSEMGLVVANQSSRLGSRPQGLEGFDVLDPSEEILYVSRDDELEESEKDMASHQLILVVTVNVKTGLYTLWTARYKGEENQRDADRRRRMTASGTRSKRRSSYYGLTTGATTPAARPPNVRESMGGKRNVSAPSFSQGHQLEEKGEENDLASQFGHEFGDMGVHSKASRRVSSMLARADLGTSHDRATFTDLATGNPGNSGNYGNLRQSIGNRASFGFNARSSLTAGNGSVFSTATSFLEAPVDRLLEELNNGGDFEGFESMGLRDSASGLPREMVLKRVESFSSGYPAGRISFEDLKTAVRPRVFTLHPHRIDGLRHEESTGLALCISDRTRKSLVVLNLKVEALTRDTIKGRKSRKQRRSLIVQVLGVRHAENVLDACKLGDGEISRILALSSTMDGRGELSLQSPWGPPIKLEIPSNLMLHEPDLITLPNFLETSREAGVKRTLESSPLQFIGVEHTSSHGKVDLIDASQKHHRLQIRMEPSNPLVKKILAVCRFALRDADKAGDSLFVGWSDVYRWLRHREVDEDDLEWTALVILLFAMAVGFIETSSFHSEATVKPTRKKRSLLRASSGSTTDLASWDSMLDQMGGSSGASSSWMMGNVWGWISPQMLSGSGDNAQQGVSKKTATNDVSGLLAAHPSNQNTFLVRCARLAREFFDSPQGEAASGADGYLPTAISQNLNTRRTALCTILVGLHLFREEQKLSTPESEASHKELGLLCPLLGQIGGWLGWPSWSWKEGGYYESEMASMDRWVFENSRIDGLDIPSEPFVPPSIFSFVNGFSRQPESSLFTLLDILHSKNSTSRKGKLWHEAFSLTPRTLALAGFLSEVRHKSTGPEKANLLLRWGLTSKIIESFPDGIAVPLRNIIINCQLNPPTILTPSLAETIDRDDLYLSMNKGELAPTASRSVPPASHDAVRDYHHIGASALEADLVNSFELSTEADRFSITRLIFRDDRRFLEASRVLNQSKAPVAECIPEPEWTDSDLLEAQKELVQHVTLRTLSVPAGRGMFMFSGRSPLLTEKLPIPSFSLQCVMKPFNVTISADRASFTEEKVCWAFFHNGAATGLAISKASKGIDTSWILFNKPQELTNRHAGFLLALGLNGHLKSLAKWVAFKYLTPKHTMTSIGLLLGLSASYMGTMDGLITRLLSVHVTRMLPQGAAELNLSPLTQTAGVMGIGLLYCNSQHRRMSEVLLSELESIELEESTVSQEHLRDEGYRLAAGFALGLINLGKGKDLRGLRDMHIVDRLLNLAVGTKNVDLVHILDRATAGATMALAIIFMKTNDAALAKKIDIPDTTVQFDYVRPDIFLLRTLTRHLIMWDGIQPKYEWVARNLPKVYRRRYRLRSVHRLCSDDMPFFNIIAGLCFAIGLRYAGSAFAPARDLLVAYLDQFIRICRLPALHYDGKLARNSVRHCQDIVALSAAAVMAGTGDLTLFRRLRSLHGRVDAETPYGSHMAAHMAVGLLFLGGGSYTLSTSNLALAALLIAFYPIFPTTVLDNKCHLQAFRHLWVLAAEARCLVPRDVDTHRPLSIPVALTLKNGAIKETIAPCLLPELDQLATIETRSPDYWPLSLDFGGNQALRDKFFGGDQSIYVRRNSRYHHHHQSDTSVFASTLLSLSEAQDILPVSAARTGTAAGAGGGAGPRGTSAMVQQLPNAAALLLAQGVVGNNYHHHHNTTGRSRQVPTHDIWDWVFNLNALRGLDVAEKSLVLPLWSTMQQVQLQHQQQQSRPQWSTGTNNGTLVADRSSSPRQKQKPRVIISLPPWLRVSAIDDRLVLDSTVRDVVDAAACASSVATSSSPEDGGAFSQGVGRASDPSRRTGGAGSGPTVSAGAVVPGAEEMVRDYLWQLRLIFDWLDHNENDEGSNRNTTNTDRSSTDHQADLHHHHHRLYTGQSTSSSSGVGGAGPGSGRPTDPTTRTYTSATTTTTPADQLTEKPTDSTVVTTTNTSLWLRKDFLEEARYQIWSMQSGG